MLPVPFKTQLEHLSPTMGCGLGGRGGKLEDVEWVIAWLLFTLPARCLTHRVGAFLPTWTAVPFILDVQSSSQ